jgi:hypothetical protein
MDFVAVRIGASDANGMCQDGPRLLKIASLVDKDLALLERQGRRVSGLVQNRDETVPSARNGRGRLLATIRSPLPHTEDRNPRITLVDQEGNGLKPLILPG